MIYFKVKYPLMSLTGVKLKEYLAAFSSSFLAPLKLIREFDEKYGVRDIIQLNKIPSYIDYDDSNCAIYLIKSFVQNDEFLVPHKIEIIEAFWMERGKLCSHQFHVKHGRDKVQVSSYVSETNIRERVEKRDIPILSLLQHFGYDNLIKCLDS